MSGLWNYPLLKFSTFTLTAGSLFYTALILLIAKIVEVFLYRLFIRTYAKKREIDPGRAFAVSRIIKYVIYFIAFLFILKAFGFKLSAVVLGSAGLLVGLGLGLQNTFSDLLAGFILLIEGNIAVGDIVVIDGMVGVVRNIKLRTTEIKTRDLVFIIVPNSKLVGNNVTNWSHNESPARFAIDVQVGYKEDIEKVERILLNAATSLPDIVANPRPSVQVTSLGEYSISLKLVIYSDELFFIEKVLSDLRKRILLDFRSNSIDIPYPLREVKVVS
ncbi:MAG: mechanosensitive ion channel [Saprospiraceae bacterium]|nr:mechanosensitive ion channel [Saprospiraceae bacterium]